jgi:hypothetical protein
MYSIIFYILIIWLYLCIPVCDVKADSRHKLFVQTSMLHDTGRPIWDTSCFIRSTSTLHDRRRPSNSGVPTHHAGAAMFMRSTTGCGTLAGPSLALEGFRSQKRKGSADSPGLKHSGALWRLARPASFKLLLTWKRYDKYIPERYLRYITAE